MFFNVLNNKWAISIPFLAGYYLPVKNCADLAQYDDEKNRKPNTFRIITGNF